MMTNIHGKRALDARLRKAASTIEDGRPMFRMVAQHLERTFKKNMTAGVDPDGHALPRTVRWTRQIRAGIGKDVANSNTPLMATGQLRNSIGSTEISRNSMRFGFHGNQARKAEDMFFGRPGKMRVKENIIRDGMNGRYFHYKPGGKWRTASESRGKFDGTHIKVNPQRREFFFMGSRDTDKAEDIMLKYVDGNI